MLNRTLSFPSTGFLVIFFWFLGFFGKLGRPCVVKRRGGFVFLLRFLRVGRLAVYRRFFFFYFTNVLSSMCRGELRGSQARVGFPGPKSSFDDWAWETIKFMAFTVGLSWGVAGPFSP